MRPFSASDLVAVWERGVNRNPVDQALCILAAFTGEPADSLAALSIGRRDARLFEVYEQLFGERLEAFAECSSCGERLEYGLNTHDLRQPQADAPPPLELDSGPLSLRLRLPDSTDLRAVRACATPEHARRVLAERCVSEARRAGAAISPQSLEAGVIDAISAQLAKADPLAEVLVDLECPNCRGSFAVLLAIEQFLWTKIAFLVRRLLREVDILARAYAWPERDILAMSAARRERYLEMATT